MPRLTTVERAFELARERRCHSLDEIRRKLREEGYEFVETTLRGLSIQRQLKALLGLDKKPAAVSNDP